MPLFKSVDGDSPMTSPSSTTTTTHNNNNTGSRPRRRNSYGWLASHLPLLSMQRPPEVPPGKTYEQIEKRLKEYRTTTKRFPTTTTTTITSSNDRKKDDILLGDRVVAPVVGVGVVASPLLPVVATFRRDEIIVGDKILLPESHHNIINNSSSSNNTKNKKKRRHSENQKKKTHFEYFAVTGIRIPDSTTETQQQQDEEEGVVAMTIEEEARYKMALQFVEEGITDINTDKNSSSGSSGSSKDRPHDSIHNYMIKQVHPDCWNDDQDWFQAITHLVREVDILKHFSHQHDNLVTLRGTTHKAEAVFLDTTTTAPRRWDSYFVMTDRVSETLAQRIDRWRQDSKDSPTVVTFDKHHPHPLLETKLLSPIQPKTLPTAHCPVVVGGNEEVMTNSVFRTRLVYAQQLASVLAFLHSKQIIVRNLHPESIGFSSADDRLQLTDLGQALQVQEYDDSASHIARNNKDSTRASTTSSLSPTTMLQQQHKDALFQMTPGHVLRYMAPELLTSPDPHHLHCSYGVDSYSWSMVCFEMFTLSKPYATVKPGQHLHHVCLRKEAGCSLVRPHVEIYHFPKPLKHLLKGAWHDDAKRRYKMSYIDRRLQKLLVGEEKGNEKNTEGKQNESPEGMNDETADTSHTVSEAEDELNLSFPRHRHRLATSA